VFAGEYDFELVPRRDGDLEERLWVVCWLLGVERVERQVGRVGNQDAGGGVLETGVSLTRLSGTIPT